MLAALGSDRLGTRMIRLAMTCVRLRCLPASANTVAMALSAPDLSGVERPQEDEPGGALSPAPTMLTSTMRVKRRGRVC